MKSRLLLTLALLASIASNAQVWNQVGNNITGSAANNQLGTAVAVNNDGTIIAVSEPNSDGSAKDRGEVKVYSRSGNTWNQMGSSMEGPVDSVYLGHAVSLSNDGKTIAASSTFFGDHTGALMVYKYVNNDWTRDTSLFGLDFGDRFGYSLELSGDGNYLVVGAKDESEKKGVTRVYDVSNGYAQVGADIVGEADWDESGYSVSISDNGSIIAIGAYHNSSAGNNAGEVKVFENQSGTWTQLGADIEGEAAFDESGVSVSLNAAGNIVAIGAKSNGPSNNTGHVRVFEYSSNTWTQLGADLDGASTDSKFGQEVKINDAGDKIAVVWNDASNSGTANVTVYSFSSNAWAKFLNDIPNTQSGNTTAHVAINGAGNTIIVADKFNGNGIARVFETCPPPPSITVQPTDITACEGDKVTLDLTTSNATKHQWQIKLHGRDEFVDFGDSTKSVSFEGQWVGSNTDSSLFRCIVSNTCKSDTSDTIMLMVNFHAKVTVTVGRDEMKAFVKSIYSPSYQWLDCNGGNPTVLNGQTGDTLKLSAEGNYAVVTNNNGCRDTSDCFYYDHKCPAVYGPGLSFTGCSHKLANGMEVTTTGTYYDTLQAYTGCDSIVRISFTAHTSNDKVLERVDQPSQPYGINEDAIIRNHFGEHYLMHRVDYPSKTYLKKFNGKQWQQLGPPVTSYSSNLHISTDHNGFTVDGFGNIYAVVNQLEQDALIVLQLKNNNWVQVGNALVPNRGGIDYFAEIVAAGTNLYVIYLNQDNQEMSVRRLVNSNWENVGGTTIPQTIGSIFHFHYRFTTYVDYNNDAYFGGAYGELFKISGTQVSAVAAYSVENLSPQSIFGDKNGNIYIAGTSRFDNTNSNSAAATSFAIRKKNGTKFEVVGDSLPNNFGIFQETDLTSREIRSMHGFVDENDVLHRYTSNTKIVGFPVVAEFTIVEKYENGSWKEIDSIPTSTKWLSLKTDEFGSYSLVRNDRLEVYRYKNELIEYKVSDLGDSLEVKTPQHGVKYQWLDCTKGNSVVANEIDSIITTTGSDNFAVELSYNSCKDTSNCYAIAIGVDEIELEGVSLYPNPTSKNFTVDLSGVNRSITITITDISGKSIMRQSYQNVNRVNLETPKASGIYFVRINEAAASKTFKLIMK